LGWPESYPKWPETCQNRWNPANRPGSGSSGQIPASRQGSCRSGQIRPVGRDPTFLARFGQSVGIRPFWPYPAGILSFWPDGRNMTILVVGIRTDQIPLPDSDDIDRMLSNFSTGKISVMVDCLNVKIDCVVEKRSNAFDVFGKKRKSFFEIY
jgi:hypothetical protein